MKRATAYRFWISDLSRGDYSQGTGMDNPTFVKIGELKVSRVDIMGKVSEKTDSGQYSAMVVQDKTGKIRVKAFSEVYQAAKDITDGSLVRVMGKIRQDEAGRLIVGEIIKKMDDTNYAVLREKELGQPSVEEISF
jgi:RPA family protein